MTPDLKSLLKQSEDVEAREKHPAPAASIYEHYMGLQRLRGWIRQN